MSEPKPSAVNYARNSSAKHKSIREQLAENAAVCEVQGWTIAAELSDPISASRYTNRVRANWAELLAMLPTVDVVVLWEPSRGDRTLATWIGFLDKCRADGVQIHAVTHHRTYDPRNARDYRSLAEDGVDSAYESDKTSARVRRGHASSAVEGRPHAPWTYGYAREYHPHTRDFVAQVAHEYQAPIVKDIIESIAAGESLHAICARLNEAGVPTPRGARVWRTNTMRGIALNVAYRPHPDNPERGCRSHLESIHVGQWPPLVDEATWQATQQVLGRNSESKRKARKDAAPGLVKYLLSGSENVMTAACGSKLSGHRTETGRGAHYSCEDDRCASAPMPELDAYVLDLIVGRLSRKDLRHVWTTDNSSEVKAAEDELAQLHTDLEANERDYAARLISARLAGAREAELNTLIEDAERRATPVGTPSAVLALMKAAKLGRKHIRPALVAMPVTSQREVVSAVFSRLVLNPATVRLTRWSSADVRKAVVAGRVQHEWR